MTAWPFILFSILFAALLCLHFVLAYRAWRNSRGQTSTDIDPNYVRVEDYFARSFRLKVGEWLRLPVRSAAPDGSRIIRKGPEYIRVSAAVEYPPQSCSDDIVVAQGNFQCRAGCTFNREIYACADAVIGAGSQLQAIAVDGNLTMDANVRIARWADSIGDMKIGENSAVCARATAGGTIQLQNGAQVGSAFAPTVSTCLSKPHFADSIESPVLPDLEIPGHSPRSGAGAGRGGIDAKALTRLSPDCWHYDGDLRPTAPLRSTTKLIVKGDCIIPAGSVLEGDLKAGGRIEIGDRSIAQGNVIASGDICFRPCSRFLGVAHAGGTMRMCRGVQGGDGKSKVAAFSSETLVIEENVVVHGKLASNAGVKVMVTRGASS